MLDVRATSTPDVEAAVAAVKSRAREIARRAPSWAHEAISEACEQDSRRLFAAAVARHRVRVESLPAGVKGSTAQLSVALAGSLATLPWHIVKTEDEQQMVLTHLLEDGGRTEGLYKLFESWHPQRAFFAAGARESRSIYIDRVAEIVRSERIEHIVLDGAITFGVAERVEAARSFGAPLFYVHEATKVDALKLSLMRGNATVYEANSRPALAPGVPAPADIKKRIASLRSV